MPYDPASATTFRSTGPHTAIPISSGPTSKTTCLTAGVDHRHSLPDPAGCKRISDIDRTRSGATVTRSARDQTCSSTRLHPAARYRAWWPSEGHEERSTVLVTATATCPNPTGLLPASAYWSRRQYSRCRTVLHLATAGPLITSSPLEPTSTLTRLPPTHPAPVRSCYSCRHPHSRGFIKPPRHYRIPIVGLDAITSPCPSFWIATSSEVASRRAHGHVGPARPSQPAAFAVDMISRRAANVATRPSTRWPCVQILAVQIILLS